MPKHYFISSKDDEILVDNLTEICKTCFANCNSKGQMVTCPIYENNQRQGKIINKKAVTFICDETKTTKVFREKLEALSYAYDDLIIPKKKYEIEARAVEQKRVNKLIHNLTSLNAHSIQEIEDFIPQEVLASNYRQVLDYIQDQIKTVPQNAAKMFLRIAKHNIHMKTEFSIFKKLDRADATLEFSLNPIRKVILNILHTFFIDFTNLGIYVRIEEYNGRVKIDYETIQVALYHLIENATKYAKPNSRIDISFNENDTFVDVLFSMKSLFLDDDEVDKIYNEGYSGKAAKHCKLNGDGIGMWQISRMMRLNSGSVRFINGKDIELFEGRKYSSNIISIRFVKK